LVAKTQVHDLAAEFGVPAEQLMGMLREMGIFVRSHMSPLEIDQVSAVRVRYEREKRKKDEPADTKKPKRRTTKAVEAPVAPVEPPAPAGDVKPARRRRTAEEVAKVEAIEKAEREKELATLEFERPVRVEDEAPTLASIEERAKALFKDLPSAPFAEPEPEAPKSAAAGGLGSGFLAGKITPAVAPSESVAAAPREPVAERPAVAAPLRPSAPPMSPRPAASATPSGTVSAGGVPLTPGGKAPFIPPRIQRPAPASASGPPNRQQGGSFGGNRGPGGPGGPSRGPGGPSRGPGGPGGARPGFGGPPRFGAPAVPGAPVARSFGPDAPKGGSAARGKKGRRDRPDQDAVRDNVLKTLQGMKGPAGKKSRRNDEPSYRELQARGAAEERERVKTEIRVNEFISVSELAGLMKISSTQIVQFAFKELGLMVTVNQRLDFDQIELIASAFGFEAVKEDDYAAGPVVQEDEGAEEARLPRPPVVTIMGHVDHGKTSLLDYLRKANVVAGEAGGITQHIGAYHIDYNGRAITFLDTPGHQAFTAMRARGAQVTDIVVLVVAADDQVMPQTVEAISHAKNAGVPMIVAINKIDLPAANAAKVKQDLLQHSVVLEDFGGTTLHAEISAKKGTGIEHLLEQILLQADILELKANADVAVHGAVLEATLDPGKGPLATILVQKGTLKTGADFICGKFSGRVRAMFDERGKQVKAAGPSIPVQILGFEGVPSAGDTFLVVSDASEAREIAQKRQRLEREAQSRRTQRGSSLEDFSRAIAAGAVSALRVIIKADQGGPAEALADSLAQLSTPEVRVDVVHRGVGAITENDILLAKASGAIVLGFHVRPDANARSAAEREGVDVRTYRIIYEAVEDVRKGLEGLLKPEQKETVLGEAEVRELFKVSKVGTVAGCMVTSGLILKTGQVRVVRDGTVVYTGTLSSLKRFKDDAKEVRESQECGMSVENFNDLKVGDKIECYRTDEIKRTLAASASEAKG